MKSIIYHATKGYFGLDDAEQIEDGNWNTHSERLKEEEEEGQAKDIKQQATGRPEEFFHVALTKDEPNILRQGLKPQIGGSSAKAGETESRIHLFPSQDDMENALMNWLGDELPEGEGITIFKVKLPSEFPVKPTFEGDKGSWEWWTDQPIPAKHLSVHSREDAEDAPSEGDEGVYYRYVHNDGRGLMNNSSLNYDKLDDDESFEIEDEYLGLQQPHESDHGKDLIFVFTPEGERKHKRLIELLSKASKTGVKRIELDPQDYEIEWESGDGQFGLKKKPGADDA